MFAGFPGMRCCRDFTGLSVEDLCKRPSEVRRRATYVTRGAWHVTECSVPETRGEGILRTYEELRVEIPTISTNSENQLSLLRLFIACDKCLLYGDEPGVNRDERAVAQSSHSEIVSLAY